MRSSGLRRSQLKYFIFGSIFGWLGSHGDYLVDFGFNIYPYANFLISLYPLIMGYAMMRYRLMDINLVITRTGIFVFVYSLLLGVPFLIAYRMRPMLVGLFGINWWIIPLAVMTLLAMLVPFVYLYILRRAEDRLLREQRQYQTTLRQASQGMSRIRDLDRLLRLIVHVVTRTVHLKKGAIYLLDDIRQEFTLRAARDRGQPTTVFSVPRDSPLSAKLSSVREPLVYEEIKQRLQDYHDPELAKLEAQMKQIDAAVIVPSFTGEKLLGFIVLGEKKSGKLYSSDDLVVFSVLANQAALAIENAQFYEDIKRTQQQLFQAEKMATIGTMANGLSHQISNRLQALGFIAGDTLDTLNLAGDKPLPQDIKDLLASVASALKRIQDNVKQGGEVVKGMLKYSRPGEAGFEQINLDKLFTAALEMAQYKVKLDTLDIVKEIPADLPDFWGNYTQLQEVFFNLIDNAFDAITERKNDLREEDFKGKISISAAPFDGHLQIRFQDNGMGIKSEDQLKIFTPFFTTKTSSKKGTGLGLYVIQKIITENHHGKIRTDSEHQQGTTFTIELPLRKET